MFIRYVGRKIIFYFHHHHRRYNKYVDKHTCKYTNTFLYGACDLMLYGEDFQMRKFANGNPRSVFRHSSECHSPGIHYILFKIASVCTQEIYGVSTSTHTINRIRKYQHHHVFILFIRFTVLFLMLLYHPM